MPTSYGPCQMYYLKGLNGARDHTVPGTTDLNEKMKHVQIPDSVRITYVKDRLQTYGAHQKKIFTVERDDGT